MHHTVPWGTTLCGAILRPPEVKSCRIIRCFVQREHIVQNHCDLVLSASKDFKYAIYTQKELLKKFLHSIKIFCTFQTQIQP